MSFKIPLRFQGLQDVLQGPVLKNLGQRGRPVPVYTIPDNQWTPVSRHYSVTKLNFIANQGSGYFRPALEGPGASHGLPDKLNHLHDVGAYHLGGMLGLSIFKPTYLVELNPKQ